MRRTSCHGNSRQDAPPLPPDPLTCHRVITSGPHVARILLVVAAVIGLGLIAYMLGRSQGAGGLPKLSVALGSTLFESRLPSYEDMAPRPAPAPPPAPRIVMKEPAPPPLRPQAKAPAKEDELRNKAMEAGVGGGGLLGALLGRNLDSPLDKAAKELLDRAPVITLDAGEPVAVILRGALRADDARGG